MFAKITEFLKSMNLIGLGFASILVCTNPALGSEPCTCGYTAYNPFTDNQRICATLRQPSDSQFGCESRCNSNRECLFPYARDKNGNRVSIDHDVAPMVFYISDSPEKCKEWSTESGYEGILISPDNCS